MQLETHQTSTLELRLTVAATAYIMVMASLKKEGRIVYKVNLPFGTPAQASDWLELSASFVEALPTTGTLAEVRSAALDFAANLN